MLPLLIAAAEAGGEMLAAGAAEGAAAGAVEGAAGAALAPEAGAVGIGAEGAAGAAEGAAGAEGTVARTAQGIEEESAGGSKNKIADEAKKKAVSFIKKKVTKTTKVSPSKLIPGSNNDGGGGGALVRRKSSAIDLRHPEDATKEEKNQDKKEEKLFNGDELIKELTAIKETLTKIKGILGSNLANSLKDQRRQRVAQSKAKAAKKESELEKKEPEKEGKKIEAPKKKMGFLDMIKNYFMNILLGSLLNFAMHYAPQIIKMFEEIGKGLENPLQQLRLGIITLTTLFPRQIKFLAKLTGKIIGPPARLIGKLLAKAGGVAANLFKKAGGFIFNLIKGPLTSLVRKIGGEALEEGAKGAAKGVAKFAGKAVSRAGSVIGTSAKILKRFKAFSRIFKRVPVVGMLIGIGIDLALGEPLDRAIIGAIGASLGGAIGGAIGQGLIPIPVVGAIVGGAVGSAIGDWAAKSMYQNITGRMGPVDKANPMPVEQKYAAGRIGGGGRSGPTRTDSLQKPTIATSGVSADVEQKAKDDVLKDKKSLDRFKSLSSVFAGTPFVGQLLKLGIDIGMGSKVEKTQTDAAAEDLGYTIGKALEDDEFSVPGLNKRIIGPLSKSLTEWAKKKIFNELKSREGSFPSIEKSGEDKKKEDAAKAGTGDPEDTGGGTSTLESAGSLSGLKDDDWKELSFIVSGEAGPGDDKYGVSAAVLNRVASPAWPNTIRAVGRQSGQFEAVSKGTARYDQKLADDLKKNQGKIADALKKLNGRDSFKGVSEYPNMGPGDVKFNSRGNYYHYRQQYKKTDPPPTNPDQHWKKWISSTTPSTESKNKGGGFGFNLHGIPFYAMGGGGHEVTSQLGMRNLTISPGMHMGVDIAGTKGEHLQAFTDGVVEATSPPGPSAGYGNWVSWIDDKGIGHLYGHMNKPPFVKAGQKVKKGTILGELGDTGNTTGPHLHWEAATNPQDTGRPKTSVLSRFNVLSKYSKEAPFGGTIKPDDSTSTTPGTSSSPAAPGSNKQSSKDSEFNVTDEMITSGGIAGDPATEFYKKNMGGGSGGKNLHPYLDKMSDEKIKKVSSGRGMCVTGSLNTMQASGVPNPAGTGNDVGNNPRGAIVQLIKSFGWKSIGGKNTTLNSPYGNVSTGIFTKSQYASAVDQGKIPSGALIFQTRYSDWNGTSPGSHGYDFAIAQQKGRALWNGQPMGQWVYGNTQKVVALTPGGVAGDGTPPSTTDSSGTSSGTTSGTASNNNQAPEFNVTDEMITSGGIAGDPATEFYKKNMLNFDDLKQKASYDQSSQQNIIMVTSPQIQQKSQGKADSTRSLAPIGSSLNSKDISAHSVRQVLSSALYKT